MRQVLNFKEINYFIWVRLGPEDILFELKHTVVPSIRLYESDYTCFFKSDNTDLKMLNNSGLCI